MSLKVHKVLYLYKTPGKFYIQPITEPSEALVIDRQTCAITVNNKFSVSSVPANATSCLIYGIVGIKHLIKGPYLIVITKASQIGSIAGEPIYSMDKADIIPFDINHDNSSFRLSSSSSSKQHDWNEIYLSMLESQLEVPNYYFSYTYDLRHSLQRSSDMMDDYRFQWNTHVMEDLYRCGSDTHRYILPIIHGFISINKITLGFGSMNWTLISRRGIRRAGTRFNTRGIDHDGNVANFVETEQIIEEPGAIISSFVQIRGSIPLIWSQNINCQYKPPIEMDSSFEHEVPMKKHLDELRKFYHNVSVVCLIDQKGHEGELGRQFALRIGKLQKYYNIPYHYFDFHKECSKMRWHRLSLLMDRILGEIDQYGFFAKHGDKILRRQEGVIRSNCIDSLDRTNVVQSMIAQHVLEQQLSQFKSIPAGTRLSNYPDFLSVFKNVWADNADALSIQYAGTPALKTDFTRTGQRTNMGLINDGVNSLTRYVCNNFYDNYRQDAIDLFLGLFEGYPSPLYRPMDITTYTSPLPVTIVMLTLVILYFYIRMN